MDPRANNKVLSVSYGNFSCSVEGFDDSFEMMTSVVEFFRNLAQQDRYFGAEPVKLTPELASELSKETQTTDIEVTQDANNLTLRKSSPSQMPTAVAPTASSAAFALNERLKRLRAAETDMTEDGDSNGGTDLADIVADPKPQTVDPEPAQSERPNSDTITQTIAVAQDEPPTDEIDDTAATPTPPQHTTPSEFATTDIPAAGAESGSGHSLATENDGATEITTDDAPTEPDTRAPAPTLTSPTPSTGASDITLEQRLRRIQAVTQKKLAQQRAAAADTRNATKSAPLNDEPDAAPQGTPANHEPLVLQDQSDDAANQTDSQNASITGDQTTEQAPDDATPPDDHASGPKRAGKTHVIQVAAPSPNDISDNSVVADTDQQAGDITATDENTDVDDTSNDTTTAPQEAALSLRHVPDSDHTGITPKRPERTTKRVTRNAENLERPSTDMVRLLKATKEQMDEPETHRKRNALEHLRAAVAATLADTSILSREKSKRENDDTQTANIAPKRPVSPRSTATSVPITPLVLHMDQRVDMDKSGSAAPDADSA